MMRPRSMLCGSSLASGTLVPKMLVNGQLTDSCSLVALTIRARRADRPEDGGEGQLSAAPGGLNCPSVRSLSVGQAADE